MSKVIQVRDVPDDVHAELVEAARQRGLSLTSFLQQELKSLARLSKSVEDNRRNIRKAQKQIGTSVDRRTILDILDEGRGA